MEERLTVTLKPGREKPVLGGHPWVFSGAVASTDGPEDPGAVCVVRSSKGEFLGRGWWSPRSQIRVRMLTWSDEPVDRELYRRRIQGAMALRRDLIRGTDAYRVLHSEGDYLPGVIADFYAGFLSMSFLTAGADRDREAIASILMEETGAKGVWERSDQSSRHEEGLEIRTGRLLGEEPPEELLVREGDRSYAVNIREGHKTGFYLDQRDSRNLAQFLARGRRVLDTFCFTGGFSVACAVGEAENILALDESEPALRMARANVERNRSGFPYETQCGNAFDLLRSLPEESFDLIILDPPPFARRASAVRGAARGYKDINLQALRLAATGGYLMTFSCSHHVDSDLFRKIVFGAAVDAGRPIQVLDRLGQPPDHPVDLSHIQGEYLTGLLLRVVG